MECNISKPFTFDYRRILIEEIALEGLGGIGIDLLWRRVEKKVCSPITDKLKRRFWKFIVSWSSIYFYELPEPVPYLELKDRFKIIDEESGNLRDPGEYLDGPYEYKPVENEYGSCAEFANRKQINDISTLSYEEVVLTYEQRLVMVASKEERFKALAPHVSSTHIAALSPVHYCLLELIGRSRENGQMTIGTTNLLKIVKDSKMLFYHRKFLKNLDLIRVTQVTQKIGDRGVKSLLLRLRRYHKSSTMSLPKIGPMHQLVEHLRSQAEYTDVLEDVFKKGILATQRIKKIQKTYNIFDYTEKEVDDTSKKLKRRYISISTKSDDESSDSDEESNAPVVKCQYKVGIDLLRQAYQNLYDAGLKGLTQIEMAQLLGVEFYTSRNICKALKSKGLVREVYEDVGRQRIGRLVIVGTCGKNNINADYEEEWRKFINHRTQMMSEQNVEVLKEEPQPVTASTSAQNLLPDMKRFGDKWLDFVSEVTKIEGLDGYELENISLLSTKKNLTLRQLKYANGIIKVINDKLAVAGYQTLNNLVSAEIGEPQMDTRALKVFLQKLHTDSLVKVFKIKWPELDRYTNYICSPQVTTTHPVMREKFHELLEKIHIAKENKITKQISKESKVKGNKALSRYSIPRYSKVRKFHEFIFKMAYFNENKLSSTLPEGFGYLIDLIPEMTVEFALGNVNLFGQITLTTVQVNTSINMKLSEVPQDFGQEIIYSSTFRNTLRENLRVLACFGLVQIVNQSLNLNFDTIMYYVNRHPKIVNTAGVWPRPDADMKLLESEYYLGSLEDVNDYWNTVFQISTNTNVTTEKRDGCPIKPNVRSMDEVQLYDNGERLGDGQGPCGFDSSFFLDQSRLWQALTSKSIKSAKLAGKLIIIPKLQRKKKPRKRAKPVVKAAKEKPVDKKKERRQELLQLKVPIARGKKTPLPLSGTWTQQDDLIITLVKAAHAIMGPANQPGSYRIRNMVAKDVLSLLDPQKTLKTCHIRATYLESNVNWAYEKQRLINEFKKRKNLTQKYEGLLKKIRIRYLTNIARYIIETRLPMLELVWILLQISKSPSYKARTACVATSIENFHEKFTVCETSDNKPHRLYNSPTATDVETTLKEKIVLTVAMSFNKELPVNIAKKIYTIFKVYPELVLRKAIEELRKSQTISAREKLCNNKIYKMNLQDLVETSYKLSAGYYRKWICKLNAEFLDSVADAFDLELPSEDMVGGSGINCFCCELHTVGLLEISTSNAPSLMGCSDSLIQEENLNVFDIEQKYKLKSGTIRVKKKSTDNLAFDNSKLEEYLGDVSRNAIVTFPEKDDIEEDNDIVRYLKDKKEKGATFHEIQEFTKHDTESLVKRLSELESKHNIRRAGFYDNRIVHIDFVKSWAMTLDRKTFLPSPWITLYGTLRYEIFFKWTNVILSKIFEHPGCSITYLCEVCELISAKSVQDICIFLMKCECVVIKVVASPKADLFSEDEEVIEPTNYNPYENPNNILILPTTTVLTRYALIKRLLADLKCETSKEIGDNNT